MQAHYHHREAPIVGRILVVEYERVVREMLIRWLRAAGQKCHATADVTEAEAALEHGAFDLVITDVRIPGHGDFEFLLKLRAEREELPVLVLTASNDPRLASRSLTYGAWGYLLKPIQLKDLLSQVNRVLRRSAHARVVPNGCNHEFDSCAAAAAGIRGDSTTL